MSKLYELAIDNDDGSPITTFRIANNIEDLTQDLLLLRLSHSTDTILVWEMNDEIERITENTIHVFNPAIQDLESGKLELPRPPMGAFSADGGFIEFFPGECICGQTDQMELGFDMGEL